MGRPDRARSGERPPRVRNELLSVEAARDEYGVIVDAHTWTVDRARTAAVRAKMRRERTSALPFRSQ